MLFSNKSKGFFVEQNDHAVLVARTSSAVAPFVIEELRECAPGDATELDAILAQLQPKKSPSGFLHASVGIYPPRRLVRRHTVEPKRMKEPAYLVEICTQQFHIDQDKYALAILDATDGTDLDLVKGTQKDAVFCGLPMDDAVETQTSLLERGIYPERLELGSIATIGGVASCLASMKVKTPVLVLEIGADATHSYIVTANGLEASRSFAQGLDAMVPIVQKELGLKDEESAKKLFYSNTFDFTGMGPLLVKRLLKELQSAIGFYEVQTGQSVGQVLTTQLSPKLKWIDGAIASALGISCLTLDTTAWLQASQISVPDAFAKQAQDIRWFGLLALMAQNDPVNAVLVEEKK